jgi:hypothetical protein
MVGFVVLQQCVCGWMGSATAVVGYEVLQLCLYGWMCRATSVLVYLDV